MAFKLKLFSVIVIGALLLTSMVSANETAPFKFVSIQVQPRVAVSSPGGTLSLKVRCEGVSGVGIKTPVSVTGAPIGTSIIIKALSEQSALVNLVFPSNAVKGRWQLLVNVGSPEPLVEQKVEVDINE